MLACAAVLSGAIFPADIRHQPVGIPSDDSSCEPGPPSVKGIKMMFKAHNPSTKHKINMHRQASRKYEHKYTCTLVGNLLHVDAKGGYV